MELSPPDHNKTRSWKTVKQLAEDNPAFSEASLRYHLFHRHTNGLNKYVRQIGRKLIIDECGFINEWIEKNGMDA
jgi:hypothetical protein